MFEDRYPNIRDLKKHVFDSMPLLRQGFTWPSVYTYVHVRKEAGKIGEQRPISWCPPILPCSYSGKIWLKETFRAVLNIQESQKNNCSLLRVHLRILT